MRELGVAIVVLLASGALSALASRWPRLCQSLGQGGLLAASIVGLVAAAPALLGGETETLSLSWTMPAGAFRVALDALSALFLIPVFALGGVAALYGRSYLAPLEGGRALGATWFFLNLLVAAMALVIVARDGLLFLLAWEIMALSPFFLVAFDDRRASSREAAWTYLVASHLGTAFLLVMFVLLGRKAGTLAFDHFALALHSSPGLASLVFVLAVLGFGAKAGFVPMHVWLPDAHPAAPSHVSALMSGVMIKTGIYGLVRMITLVDGPVAWWGWLLIAIGVSSGILGVVFALAQHDLKRLLAYHSIENIGIITLGLGIGLVGSAANSPGVATLGFAAGLLHVVNHGLFKGLLFLGAGAVQHGAGTLEIDQLGGLMKRMPWTGAAFLIGSAAIVGLPPLNGFVSEFLLFLSGFTGMAAPATGLAVPAFATIGALGLISGLAAACFAKAFGIVFLGPARSTHAETAHEVARPMRAAMLLLAAAACAGIGLAAPLVVRLIEAPVAIATGLGRARVAEQMDHAVGALWPVAALFIALVVLVPAILVLRRGGLARHGVRRAPTWGCGYLQPSARMAYTASSFAEPLTRTFAPLLGTRVRFLALRGYFPHRSAFRTSTPDPFRERLFAPLFRAVEHTMMRLRWLQHGNIHLYVLYIAVTLVALLTWQLR